MHRLIGTLAAALEAGGIVIVATHFRLHDPWLFVGLTGCLGGLTTATAALVARRSRTLDEEFEAGYRIGFRAGRRKGLRPAPAVVAIAERRSRQHGRVSKTPVRSPSGNRAAAGRHAAHQDGSA